MDLNKAMMIGRLTRDPEGRTTPQGATVASFAVATNFVWNDANGQRQERVEFHNVVAWRKLADICTQYLRKGSRVYIEGRMQTRDWEGQDGIKRYRTEIVADNMIMLDSRGSAAGQPQQSGPAPLPTIQADAPDPDTQIPQSNEGGNSGSSDSGASEDEIKIENIPF
ncbi:single-stranded DNA-binding protein [Candidatus Falkowbacteria bacterium]|jgi:single-strand DNA-binding protein|nr:single-stranded DNA-binding protein [Candidatus Falkowbacteria bacterium]MBT5502672.1 single-stranded DNA-binding protein [Candidatus Falkowbacteria bacterium]MBT6574162.1 single-stranded DNA-binding protein [Candidatus Falkowbacteria bacterium]MBT7348691.1 single-stranded DNA-binding protein [Candidatus Falkowbacteria bacterium]MBT7500481.1 single-stranded DNA-binding protein [Candidatus Falkowbacteria bacterium]